MLPPASITDIWFESSLPLKTIAERLGLSDVSCDAEDYWSWCIGWLGEVELDVTRGESDDGELSATRIFRVDRAPVEDALKREVVARLRTFLEGPIRCGRWIHRTGREFDLVCVEEHG